MVGDVLMRGGLRWTIGTLVAKLSVSFAWRPYPSASSTSG